MAVDHGQKVVFVFCKSCRGPWRDNYPNSIINNREFASSRDVLDAKAKKLRVKGQGERKNRALPYNSDEEEPFWCSGLIVRATTVEWLLPM